MNLFGKMCFKTTLKVTKNQFHPLFRRYIFRKTIGGEGGGGRGGWQLRLKERANINRYSQIFH